MWTSKLGNKYPMASMQQGDQAAQKELKRLRALPTNSRCFDCGRQETSWASVNHGTFLCVVCSDVHRSVGTHITKVKGCTGTYLWGPDELEQMQTIGNQRGEALYGKEKVSPDARKELKQQHVIDKYEKKLFVNTRCVKPSNADVQYIQTREKTAAAPRMLDVKEGSEARKRAPLPPQAQEISRSLFDELFSEVPEVGLVDEVVVNRLDDIAIKPDSSYSNNLDDFLDSVLCAETKPTMPKNSTSLIRVGLNERAETLGPVCEDPFFDWAF
jgi:transcription elongation factor Elf1